MRFEVQSILNRIKHVDRDAHVNHLIRKLNYRKNNIVAECDHEKRMLSMIVPYRFGISAKHVNGILNDESHWLNRSEDGSKYSIPVVPKVVFSVEKNLFRRLYSITWHKPW